MFIIRSDRANYIRIAHQFYTQLIDSVASELADKTNLIIIPHGRLSKIPFEALLIKEPVPGLGRSTNKADMNYSGLEFLVNKFNISYHYSATLYLNTIKKSNTLFVENQADFIGFAPVFREKSEGSKIFAAGLFDHLLARGQDIPSMLTRDRKSFHKLPFSKKEIENIAHQFERKNRKSLCFINADASEQNFKHNAGKYSYIHLATHSFINEDHPALSGIAFYQPKATDSKATEDGMLYAGETYNLTLNADLVVLSSCESGLKINQGRGSDGIDPRISVFRSQKYHHHALAGDRPI